MRRRSRRINTGNIIKRNFNFIIFFLFILSSCSEVSKKSDYKPLNPDLTLSDDSPFIIEMPDSLQRYNIFICSRIDTHLYDSDHLIIESIFISPSDIQYRDTVSLPIVRRSKYQNKRQRIKVLRGGSLYDYEWSYYEGVSPEEYGEWRVKINILSPEAKYKAVHGFGIRVCKSY